MSSSLIKFCDQTDGNSRGKLFWGRLGVDGLPFRGTQPPTYTSEEFDARVVSVGDPRNGTYRTWIPEENKRYLEALDRIINGWARLICVDRWRDQEHDRHVVYMEWAEFFLEDGSPTQINIPAGGTVGYGQPSSQ